MRTSLLSEAVGHDRFEQYRSRKLIAGKVLQNRSFDIGVEADGLVIDLNTRSED